MGDAGWGIIFVLGIAGMVTIIISIVLWHVFTIAQMKTRMSLKSGLPDRERRDHQPVSGAGG